MTAIQPNLPELLGTAEVAEVLDTAKSRVAQMREEGTLPTPIAILASGPVWDAESIKEFKKTWKRVGGRNRPVRHRYVEVGYHLPGDRLQQFMAVLTEATSPKEALEYAIAEVKREHPDARRIEEFMQRTITPKRARSIRARFDSGTWEGWNFGRESVA